MAVGTRDFRVTKAIHWYFTTDKDYDEIAEELGVARSTVKNYIHDPPDEDVKQALEHQETQVRLTAFEELRRQLRAAGERSRSAEKPVKMHTDANGDLLVKDVHDDDGALVKRYPIPHDFQMGPDEEARYYARGEAREILDMLIDLVGASEPDQLEVEGNGIVIHTQADGDE